MNSKDKNYKKVLKNRERHDELLTVKRNLGYTKLEKPYQLGWDAYYTVREDILRSDDGRVLDYIVNRYTTTVTSKDKDFRVWDYTQRKYLNIKPTIDHISEETFLSYKPCVQKFFVHDKEEDKPCFWSYSGYIKYYKCIIPEWKLCIKKERHWVTQHKVLDELIEQELSELDYEYYNLTNNRSWYSMGNKSKKPYQNIRNRQFRRNVRQEINRCISFDDFDELNLPIIKKNVLYDMW